MVFFGFSTIFISPNRTSPTCFGDDDDDDSFDLGDLSVLSGLGDLGKLAKAFGGKIVDGTDTIETKEGKTILKSNRQRIVIEKDGSMTIDDGEGNVMKIGADGNVKGMQQSASKPLVGSNTDPIQQFGNLRAAYLNNLRDNIDNTNLLTGLANSILDSDAEYLSISSDLAGAYVKTKAGAADKVIKGVGL